MCVNPVPLPYKHWFESIVKAVVELVYIIMVFVVALYIPLVPSENKKLGFVIDDGLEDKKEIVL